MLICNNCFTPNENGAEYCSHCHMKGHFTHQDDEGRTGDPLQADPSIVMCQNCGSDTPADEEKCIDCHFPLPRKAPQLKAEANGSAHYRLNVR